MIEIKTVTEHTELAGIQQLQQVNLKKKLDPGEATSEGFVTAEYSIDFLETMHAASPSIIAKDGDEVVGYALVALTAIRDHHDLLADLFNVIDRTLYHGLLLKDAKYVIVGQLCVAKNYRGMGLVDQMYGHFKKCLSNRYDYCITDVASENTRSLKAHQKAGFQVIDSLSYGGISWDIVLWDWTV